MTLNPVYILTCLAYGQGLKSVAAVGLSDGQRAQEEDLLLFCLDAEVGVAVQQLIDVCVHLDGSLDVVPDKLDQTWQPDLEHLVASVLPLDLYVGLQSHRFFFNSF